VVEVCKTKKNNKSKKATTHVKASYKIGDVRKEKSLLHCAKSYRPFELFVNEN